jgi:hypothetical protein
MPYPYGTQNAPVVGNGLGGLPRRAVAAAAKRTGGPLDGAPIKRFTRSYGLSYGVTLYDRSKTFINATVKTGSYGSVFFPAFYPTDLASVAAVSSSGATNYNSFQLRSTSTEAIFSGYRTSGAGNVLLEIYEYDVEVLSVETVNFTSTAYNVEKSLTNPIIDPNKTMIMAGTSLNVVDGKLGPVNTSPQLLREFSTNNILMTPWDSGSDNFVVCVPNATTLKWLGGSFSDNATVIVAQFKW